jgi:magnesium-transporting ATPase (P-type)
MSNTTCICVDKTGTLTTNEPVPLRIVASSDVIEFTHINDFKIKDMVAESILVNTLKRSPESIDAGLLKHGELQQLFNKEDIEKFGNMPQKRLLFNSYRKMMSSLYTTNDQQSRLHIKGNINKILSRCTNKMKLDGTVIQWNAKGRVEDLKMIESNTVIRFVRRWQ